MAGLALIDSVLCGIATVCGLDDGVHELRQFELPSHHYRRCRHHVHADRVYTQHASAGPERQHRAPARQGQERTRRRATGNVNLTCSSIHGDHRWLSVQVTAASTHRNVARLAEPPVTGSVGCALRQCQCETTVCLPAGLRTRGLAGQTLVKRSMGYTKEALEGMARRDLQDLAKKHDIKANQKTADIVKELLKVGDAATSSSPKKAAMSPPRSPAKKHAASPKKAAPANPPRSPSKKPAASPKKAAASPGTPQKNAGAAGSPQRHTLPAPIAVELKQAVASRSPPPQLHKPTPQMKQIHLELKQNKRKADDQSHGSPAKVARLEPDHPTPPKKLLDELKKTVESRGQEHTLAVVMPKRPSKELADLHSELKKKVSKVAPASFSADD